MSSMVLMIVPMPNMIKEPMRPTLSICLAKVILWGLAAAVR